MVLRRDECDRLAADLHRATVEAEDPLELEGERESGAEHHGAHHLEVRVGAGKPAQLPAVGALREAQPHAHQLGR